MKKKTKRAIRAAVRKEVRLQYEGEFQTIQRVMGLIKKFSYCTGSPLEIQEVLAALESILPS